MRSRVWRCTRLPLTLAVSLVSLLALASCGPAAAAGPAAAHPTPTLQGTNLGAVPAPAFQLTDQHGATVSLQQFRGHPVVLTVLDSVCTSECPITAQSLNTTAQLLGTKTNDVVWIALSVDPWSDTPATAQAFMTTNDVKVPLHFLLGTEAQLRPVWNAYHLSVIHTSGDITHTIGLYVIDQQGRERVWFDVGWDPMMLSNDLKALLAS